MTYTPIPQGTLNWDVPVNAALTDQDTRITTNAAGLTTKANKSGDTFTGPVNGTTFTSSGTSEFANIRLGSAGSFGGGTGAVMAIANAGTVPTSAPSGVAVYSEGGVLKVRQNNGTVVDTGFTQATAIQSRGGGLPSDYGALSWSFDPANAINGVVPTSGTIVWTRHWIPAGTVTSLGMFTSTVAVTPTAGQNFMGIYDAAGNKLGQTADLSTAFTTLGYNLVNLVTPVTISTAGFYNIALLGNAATNVGITRGSNNAIGTAANLNLPAASYRFANGPTAQTSLPATVNLGTRTSSAQTYWMTTA